MIKLSTIKPQTMYTKYMIITKPPSLEHIKLSLSFVELTRSIRLSLFTVGKKYITYGRPITIPSTKNIKHIIQTFSCSVGNQKNVLL